MVLEKNPHVVDFILVTMEFTAFVEVDSIGDDMLTPPKSWNCTNSGY